MALVKCYSELARLETFEERYAYLKLGGMVGRSTFGFDRHINQRFYTSPQWKSVKSYVTVRDNGCDLGIAGHEIHDRAIIHHINPMDVNSILHQEDWILDPEYLILTTHKTHNAIHYGDESQLPREMVERKPGDTKLW